MRSSLQEAIGILVFLVLMGIINACEAWGCRAMFVNDFTAELRCMLNLDDPQTSQVEELNYTFYDNRSKTSFENIFSTINYHTEVMRLHHEREQHLMKLLTKSQQDQWQRCNLCKGR